MSIIQEALKKAQNTVKTDTAPRQQFQITKRENIDKNELILPLPIIDTEKSSYHGEKSWIKLLLPAALIFIMVGIFVGRYLQPNTHKKNSFYKTGDVTRTEIRVIKKANAAKPLPFAAIDKKPEFIAPKPALSIIPKIKTPMPNFSLNGIMYLEKGPRAIINNVVVEEGDTIRGATVLKITKAGVRLLFEDSEIRMDLR